MLDFYVLITIAAITIAPVILVSAVHYSSMAAKIIMTKKEKEYEFKF